MRLNGSDLTLSATDLSNFLGCRHRTALDLALAHGHRKRRHYGMDPILEVLIARGNAHEKQYVDSLRSVGKTVVDLSQFKTQDRSSHVEATIDAMRGGCDAVVQGALCDTCWFGYPDVLIRVEQSSDFGDWSYEVLDT